MNNALYVIYVICFICYMLYMLYALYVKDNLEFEQFKANSIEYNLAEAAVVVTVF